jgi:hypothetical protein
VRSSVRHASVRFWKAYEKRNFVFGYEAYPAEILRRAIDKPRPESKIFTTDDTESTEEESRGFSCFTRNGGRKEA